MSLLAFSCFVVAFVALHQGSYSLVDRQLLAVFVWVAVGVAAMVGLLPAVRPPRVLLFPLLVLLALAALTLISLAWTESAERTYAEFARIVGYLGVLVLVWIGVGRSTWRLVAAGLLGAGILVSVLVVLSRFWPVVFPSDTVALNLKTTRINYPFGYWNAVGCWCAMTATLSLSYAVHARAALVRGLALAAVPVCAVGLYLALSRAGFGGAIVGAVAVVLLARYRWLAFAEATLAALGGVVAILVLRNQRPLVEATGTDGAWTVAIVLMIIGALLGAFAAWAGGERLAERTRMPRESGRRLGIAGGVVAVVALALAIAMFGGRAYDEFTQTEFARSAHNSDARLSQLNGNRHNLWNAAWDAFSEQPLTGIGPGTFEFWWSRNGTNGEFVRDAHSIYLEALAELGVFGLLVLLTFFAGLIWSAWRARAQISGRAQGIHGGLLAVFICFAVQAGADWMWESTAIALFGLLAAAIAGAAASERRTTGMSATVSIGLALVAVLAAITLFAGMANQRQIEKSQAAFRAGNIEASLKHADDAIDAERWSATAYGQRALALEKLGNHEAALVAIKEAAAKEPYNWRWPLIESRIYVELGEPEAATAAYRRARGLRPYLPLFGADRRGN